MIANGAVGARVSGVDGFGNVQLNVRLSDLESAGVVTPLRVSGRDVPVAGVFADVAEGMLAAIVDSQGFVALVVNRGSASALLDLGPGDAVVLE
jgi:S-adenosylmethionine hydrolase